MRLKQFARAVSATVYRTLDSLSVHLPHLDAHSLPDKQIRSTKLHNVIIKKTSLRNKLRDKMKRKLASSCVSVSLYLFYFI